MKTILSLAFVVLVCGCNKPPAAPLIAQDYQYSSFDWPGDLPIGTTKIRMEFFTMGKDGLPKDEEKFMQIGNLGMALDAAKGHGWFYVGSVGHTCIFKHEWKTGEDNAAIEVLPPE